MRNKNQTYLFTAICVLAAFVLWTVGLRFIDVQPIGPHGSSVGFAALNRSVHTLTGVHMDLYTITNWLGLVPVAFAFGFAVLGLVQWIARKHICRVDGSILILGVFYIVIIAAYFFFESNVINYRPVLINGYLEVSYPSSTTLLVMAVMPTAIMQLNHRIKSSLLRHCVVSFLVAFTVFMVVGRLVSGVHWFSDIIGSGLLCTGLVMLYHYFCQLASK